MSALYPSERAALRVLAVADRPLTTLDVAARMRAGASGKLPVGVTTAIVALNELGYVQLANAGTLEAPTEWRVTSFGKLAHEQLA